jgi:acyl dehydratase
MGAATSSSGMPKASTSVQAWGRRSRQRALTVARWWVPADAGRRYAPLSGDWNPIHLNALAARLFGFRRAIAHGMWVKARCLAALEGRLPERLVATPMLARRRAERKGRVARGVRVVRRPPQGRLRAGPGRGP